jgi:hypothetical protein
MLKPPGIRHLKVKYVEVLSSFSFNFKLRRYSRVDSFIDNKDNFDVLDFDESSAYRASVSGASASSSS